MGQPEDYRIDDDSNDTTTFWKLFKSKKRKKLYRDKDRGLIGGVLVQDLDIISELMRYGLKYYF
jgi:hypothetical protein